MGISTNVLWEFGVLWVLVIIGRERRLAGWMRTEERVGAVQEIQGAHPPGWSC